MLKVVFITTTMLSPVSAIASTNHPIDPTPMYGWQNPQERQVVSHSGVQSLSSRRHKYRAVRHHHYYTEPPITSVASVTKLKTDLNNELKALKQEIADIRSEVGHSSWEGVTVPFLSALLAPKLEREAIGLPNLRVLPPGASPSKPLPLASADGLEGVDEVREARLYLIKTATVGYTMSRLTPEVAIGRLHPAFAVKLAEAVRLAREQGLAHAGIFSAYRPPNFGIGGFRDKFNSLHSYGLAVDAAGIGSAGSPQAGLWEKIVKSVGLYLPYGSRNHAEYNHVQMVPTKVATKQLRQTISASAPKDLEKMWVASGVKVPSAPVSESAQLLPDVNFVATASEETAVPQFLRAHRHALRAKW